MLNKALYYILLRNIFRIVIMCIGVSPPPPSKTPPPHSCQAHPLFKQPSLYIGFSWNIPKSRIFQWTPSFSSLTPSYLLKVTKFLVEISQFEFLVMTEKNIFAHKLILPLNIQILIFWFIFLWKLQPTCPPMKSPPSFPANPFYKLRFCQAPPFLKIWLELHLPPSREGWVHTTIV